ncbi:MAG: hypothetical protein KGL39_25285 [Patescibacteria group bacterium]|nr:hypothetical protein [Patescibacteria group bacterium]
MSAGHPRTPAGRLADLEREVSDILSAGMGEKVEAVAARVTRLILRHPHRNSALIGLLREPS